MKSSFVVAMLCLSLNVGAQTKELPIVVAGGQGYYRIALSPAVICGSESDLSDLRIVDSKGGEVAYYIAPNSLSYSVTDFVPYKADIAQIGKITQVVAEIGTDKINSLDFEIKNANCDKIGALSASNDKKQWYALRDKIAIDGVYSGDNTSRIVNVNFPMSDYKYYRLTISDSTSSPLNILRVGAVNRKSHTTKSEQLPMQATKIERWSKDKHSYFKLCFADPSPVTRIDLHISAPKYFNRHISIYGRYGNRYSYQLKGEGGQVYRLGFAGRPDTLTIDIDNMDDAALVVDSVQTFVDSRSVIANLSDGDYKLTFGDGKSAPRYDLSFVAHLPDSLPVIWASSDVVVKAEQQAQVEGESWQMWKEILLWVAIAAVIAQILRMTLKVARKTEDKG